jgi:two-component system response regulator MprA
MAGRLLVVNDEPKTGRALQGALAMEGFDVILASDAREALDVVQDSEPDAVIVDVVESDARGAALCRRLREASPRLPLLMLGDADTVVQRTGGLAAGADDFLAKPFVLVELLTRIRGLLRRKGRVDSEVLRFADLVLDQTTHEVVRDGRSIELTLTEFMLLELFLRHPRELLPRALIFTNVWGFDFGSSSNSLNVRIGHLRRKLEAGAGRASSIRFAASATCSASRRTGVSDKSFADRYLAVSRRH